MELHVSLVGRKDLTGEIYRQLRWAILDSRLPPGHRPPASRELAAQLSVSRTTVVVAYDRLIGEGFVTGRVGAGTFVSDDLPGAGHRTGATGGMLRPRPIWDDLAPLVFERAAEFDFRPGVPDARLFRYKSWRGLLARELSATAVGAGHYADPAGHAGAARGDRRPYRCLPWGAGHRRGRRRDQRDPAGGRRRRWVLLAPGDRVAVEDPCYRPTRRLLQTLGAKVTGVPVDDQGMIVDAIPAGARLVCVTPRTSSRWGCRCRCRGAWPCWPGPSATRRPSWRTTTTASSASAAAPSNRSRPWTAHLVDHVLRADASGRPFTGEVTWFTPAWSCSRSWWPASSCSGRLPPVTVPVRQGGRLVERDLEGFLRSTGTTAFLAVKGDTLVAEAYFHGYLPGSFHRASRVGR